MDRIEVRGMRAYGRHGANPGETDVAQPFDIDLAIEIDLAAAAASDRLDDTFDYAALHRDVIALVATRSYALLERLGRDLLDAVWSDARVHAASVSIGKPRLLGGATPVVTLQRRR